MKHLLIVLISIGFVNITMAQIVKPVDWSFSSVKKGDNSIDVVLTADIDPGWHIYSQFTPEGGPIPTEVTFVANRAVEITGEVREEGKMEAKMDEMFGVEVKSYANSVDFKQSVKLKIPVTTYLMGSVEFMVCDNTRCLPPEVKTFKIKLEK
ncbi:protein-disulfide reductase DsbD domain-containing protein [Membranihabitans marinus]|uniref:protein-disulfide reductase DsbD domain-containing protein n=1 Tax=Membranihabitans marinus TaxID=1227546 RepID=UPI001F1D5E79|nr:protein-disulfide reductase DsbD domain-containing protein [Membranihabitans marinus]